MFWFRYAFAMYTSDGEASNAIRMFNNYMIRPSWQLGKKFFRVIPVFNSTPM